MARRGRGLRARADGALPHLQPERRDDLHRLHGGGTPVRPVPDPFADPLHCPLGDGRLVRVDRRQRRDRVRAFLAAVLGTAVGVLLRNVISNIINHVGGLDSNIQSAISGAFLLVVVVLQQVLSGGSVRLRRRG